MTFKKGEKRTKEFAASAKRGRNLNYGTGRCSLCGAEFKAYKSDQKTCRSVECVRENTRRRYREAKLSDPVLAKAITLSGSIRLGKNKREIMVRLITAALGKPCEYCPTEVTLENASIDHKTPRTFSRVHNKSKKKKMYTSEEVKELDREENLHIVCRDCNQLKSDMNDEQFRYFLSSLSSRGDVMDLVKKRMRRSVFMFTRGR